MPAKFITPSAFSEQMDGWFINLSTGIRYETIWMLIQSITKSDMTQTGDIILTEHGHYIEVEDRERTWGHYISALEAVEKLEKQREEAD